jgi:hypothetical protein
MTMGPSQQGYIAGCGVNVPTTFACGTSTDGSVVGVPNPLTATINTTSGSGSLTAGVYYTVYEFYDAAGHVTLASPETRTTLSVTESLVVNPPSSGVPSTAVGMDVFIGTSSGAETLQGQTTGSAAFVQSTALSSGASPATTNTTLCKITANDAVWPVGTGYNVSLVDSNGNPVQGYPMQWQLLGPGSTYNLSNGLPYYHGVVLYPVPILAQPANHGQQSISGPLSLGGYNLTNVGKLGVGTATPGWGVDVEGAGLGGLINSVDGYLINGDSGTAGQCLASDGTAYDTEVACLTSAPTVYYQTIDAAGTPLAQRSVLNFLAPLTAVDNSSPARTNVGITTVGNGGSVVETAALGVSGNCMAWGAAGATDTGSPCASSGYTSGNNSNGYWIKDPVGHIHQWGTLTGSGSVSTGTTVSFPIAFTAASSITVNATSITISGHGIGFASIQSGTVSTSGFTVEIGSESTVDGLHWSADGY